MADDGDKRKGGGAKTSRSETVTVRLEPKLRYLAELAGRKQRRTLSSFIEWAIQETLGRVDIDEGGPHHQSESIAEASSRLWDVDEQDRFAKLAMHFPELLTHDEQVLWKLVRENGAMWDGYFSGPGGEYKWDVIEEKFRFRELREHWATFNAVAKGEMQRSALPTWKRFPREGEQVKKQTNGFDDMDDDIPF